MLVASSSLARAAPSSRPGPPSKHPLGCKPGQLHWSTHDCVDASEPDLALPSLDALGYAFRLSLSLGGVWLVRLADLELSGLDVDVVPDANLGSLFGALGRELADLCRMDG